VFEIGMNHRGETRELAAIAQPTIAVITNAQREHQEFMRSVDEVAAEHADVIRALRIPGTAVLNADDPRVATWRAAANERGSAVLTFGLDRPADISAHYAAHPEGSALGLVAPAGNAHVLLRVAGRHMASNALAATAAAHAAGLPLTAIVSGLEAFRPVRGRLVDLLTAAGVAVIDDSYNANPDSVRAAIDVLAARAPPRWLVLGDMGEVGDQGPAFHQEIGAYARARGIGVFWCAGDLCAHAAHAYGAAARHFADTPALLAALGDSPAAEPAFGAVLVKGSRFMGMERAVAALVAHDDAQEGAGDAA
jgi:UDP-N-acetylmuramoyl-tripeptide--D-alanyl-D-alanine ligase